MVSEYSEEDGEEFPFNVLILVLVEDGLGEFKNAPCLRCVFGLNPCFSGGWSRRRGFNPRSLLTLLVLILVLVEDGLGEWLNISVNPVMNCLNPCFSGGWSRRSMKVSRVRSTIVLILVLVEDGLGENVKSLCIVHSKVLILVLVEDGLGAAAKKHYRKKQAKS